MSICQTAAAPRLAQYRELGRHRPFVEATPESIVPVTATAVVTEVVARPGVDLPDETYLTTFGGPAEDVAMTLPFPGPESGTPDWAHPATLAEGATGIRDARIA